MSDAEKATAVVQESGTSVVLKKRGPLTRTSVFIEDLIREQIKTYAEGPRMQGIGRDKSRVSYWATNT